jgi:hypothetical protein
MSAKLGKRVTIAAGILASLAGLWVGRCCALQPCWKRCGWPAVVGFLYVPGPPPPPPQWACCGYFNNIGSQTTSCMNCSGLAGQGWCYDTNPYLSCQQVLNSQIYWQMLSNCQQQCNLGDGSTNPLPTDMQQMTASSPAWGTQYQVPKWDCM